MAADFDVSSAAYDIRAIERLRMQAARLSPQGIAQIAKQFEGLFVNMMMKSMRSATSFDGLLNSQNTRFYTSLYDQQLSQQLSGSKGLGLADMLIKQMNKNKNGNIASVDEQKSVNEEIKNNSSDIRKLFFNMENNFDGLTPAAAGQLLGQMKQPLFNNKPSYTENKASFISRLLEPAKRAAEKSGIPHHLILAQAALESGWGKKEILMENGQGSFNLFGIKAGRSWKGETTQITTTEYVNGIASKVKDFFRVYGSYQEALNDYVGLLTRNPRYKEVVSASDTSKAAQALQQSGYASDPNYANKLIQIISQLKSWGMAAETMPNVNIEASFDLSELF